ncbi:MAG: thiamine biosynthesis protein [Crocinitomicaceae bacterium]|nr:thiamine biosynthesis protein [Crocinitomicaceae bacterium]|tara:strand:+ start:5163 stop:6254 length:1092 start_codon:yes stop_codon:yes gene_type:complete
MKTLLIYLLIPVSVFFGSCDNNTRQGQEDSNQPKEITGEAQGTTYSIKYYGNNTVEKQGVDSVLKAIDASMSLWDENSIISRFNSSEEPVIIDHHFFRNLIASFFHWKNSEGAFNPLVKPLVDYWGFGVNARKVTEVDSAKIEVLLGLMNMDSLRVIYGSEALKIEDVMLKSTIPDTIKIMKLVPGMQLDFNAIAQGYSADMLGRYMLSQQIENYLIEIGGEMTSRGQKSDGSKWLVGIDRPEENAGARKLEATIELDFKSIATSGNYRKFYEVDGKKYHHTIDALTGYPAKKEILSATVISTSCAESDAFATTFMVTGLEKSIDYVEKNGTNLDAFFIYSNEKGGYEYYISKGLEKKLKLKN